MHLVKLKRNVKLSGVEAASYKHFDSAQCDNLSNLSCLLYLLYALINYHPDFERCRSNIAHFDISGMVLHKAY